MPKIYLQNKTKHTQAQQQQQHYMLVVTPNMENVECKASATLMFGSARSLFHVLIRRRRRLFIYRVK